MGAAFTTADPVQGAGYATLLRDWQTGFGNVLYLRESRVFGRLITDVVKTTDTVFQDLPGLAFPILPAERWRFTVLLHLLSNITADVKLTLTGPAGAAVVRFGGVNAGSVPRTGSVSAFGSAVDINTQAVEEMFVLGGLIVNGATAGMVQVQAAQNVSSGTTTIRAGSSLAAFRYDV